MSTKTLGTSRKTVTKLIEKSFYWPNLSNDAKDYCIACDRCQKVTKNSPAKSPLVERELVSVHFERVAIDIVGPLTKSKKGHQFLLTYIDVASRWPEAIPLRTVTAKSVLGALTPIFSCNGFPRILISDNAKQFTGKAMKDYCKKFNIQQVHSAPYRPQSNGLIERFTAQSHP